MKLTNQDSIPFLHFKLSTKNIYSIVALPILLFIMYLSNRVHTCFSIKQRCEDYVQTSFFLCLLLPFETELRLCFWNFIFVSFLFAGIPPAGEIHIWAWCEIHLSHCVPHHRTSCGVLCVCRKTSYECISRSLWHLSDGSGGRLHHLCKHSNITAIYVFTIVTTYNKCLLFLLLLKLFDWVIFLCLLFDWAHLTHWWLSFTASISEMYAFHVCIDNWTHFSFTRIWYCSFLPPVEILV
jgi:hypothetical protein